MNIEKKTSNDKVQIGKDVFEGLSADPRSSGYPNFNSFIESLGPLPIRSEISSSIQQKLQILHRLLIHCYFEYEFYDIALVRALQLFEMALKVRFAEIEYGDSERATLSKIRKSLHKLIDWAGDKELLEYPVEVTHRIRKLRNYIIHGDPNSLMGITCLQAVFTVIDFINDLYEDVETRKKRHEGENELKQILQNYESNGAILTISKTRLIIFLADVLMCFIEKGKFEYHVCLIPIFDPKWEDGSMSTPDPILLEFDKYKYDGDLLRMYAGGKLLAKLEKVTDTVNRGKFDEFIEEYKDDNMLEFVIKHNIKDYKQKIKRTHIIETYKNNNIVQI